MPEKLCPGQDTPLPEMLLRLGPNAGDMDKGMLEQSLSFEVSATLLSHLLSRLQRMGGSVVEATIVVR